MLTRRDALLGSAALAASPAITRSAMSQSNTEGPVIKDVTPVEYGDVQPGLGGQPAKQVELLAPPFVHAHEQRTESPPHTVRFTMDIIEKEIEIDDDGTRVHAMTFNGTVPGPMMVVHEGDHIELTLRNLASNTLQHNIDFHASTGALGGGGLTLVNPGEYCVLRWKATKPGVCLSLRTWRGDDSLACRLWDEWGGDGVAA